MSSKMAFSTVTKSGTLSRWWIVAGVIAVVAGAIELAIWLRLPPPPPKIQSSKALTNDILPKHNLVASADGTQLYFDESSLDGSTLARVPNTGGAVTPINSAVADPHILDISKQSELLISSGGVEADDAPFWVVSTASGSARRVGDVLGHDAVWDPAGKLVFVNGRDFYIAQHDGANPTKLATAPGRPFAVRFSPDGSRMRFTIGDPNSRSTMWEARSDGGEMRPIFPRPGWKAPPAPCCGTWTPDGRYFAFVNRGDIWIVADLPKTDSEPVQLTYGPLRFHALVPTTDGKRLFAIGVEPQAELVRYDKPSGRFVQFLGGISVGDVDFSQDGQWVTYVTYPDGSLWRSKVDGSEKLRLTSLPMHAASAHWSPDGMQIAFSAAKPGEAWKVLVISKDGGSPEALTPNNQPEADPTWSPDGKSLAFVRFTRPSQIALLDLKTHSRSELPGSEGMWRPRWSPDGHSLVALSAGSSRLMICDLPARKWRRLADDLGTIGTLTWSHDGKYIYFDASSPHDSTFLRVRASDGKVEPIASLKKVRRYLGISGPWSGLAAGDIPLLALDVSRNEVYALDWQLP